MPVPNARYPRYDLTEIKVTSARRYLRFKLTVGLGPKTWVLFKGCVAGVGKDGVAWTLPSQTPDKRFQHTVWSEELAQLLARGLEKDGWFKKLLVPEGQDAEPEGELSL